MSTGTILNVEAVQLGSDLAVVANVGDSTLTVSDAADFYEAGGYCQLNGVTYQFTTDTTGADVLHLTGTVTTAGAVGDMVWVWDNQQSAIAVEYQADVAEPMSDNTGDPIRCIIDHGVFPYLPLGARNVNNGESEGCEFAETAHGRHMITSITGRANQMSTDSTALTQVNTNVSTAQSAANTAQATANGKNTVYYSTTAPGAGTYTNGDIWFVFASGQITAQYQYQGGWVSQQITNTVIANLDAGKITTGYIAAARIQAQSITTDKLSIGSSAGQVNLVPNGSFEDGSPSWTPGGGAGAYVSATGGYTGSGCGVLPNGSAANYNSSLTQAGYFPVVAGQKFTSSAWFGGNSGNSTALMRMWFFDANKTVLSSNGNHDVTVSVAAGTWVQAIDHLVAPSGAQYAQWACYNYNPSGGATTLLVDDVLVVRPANSLTTTPGGANRIEFNTDKGDDIQFYSGGVRVGDIYTLPANAGPLTVAGLSVLGSDGQGTGGTTYDWLVLAGGDPGAGLTSASLSALRVLDLRSQNDYVKISPAGTNVAQFNSNGITLSQPTTLSAQSYLGSWLTTQAGTTLAVNGTNALVKLSSSRRYKTDITDLRDDYPSVIDLLRPITYRDKAHVEHYEAGDPDPMWAQEPHVSLGLIAEEVHELGFVEAVLANLAGEIESIQYERLIVPLIHDLRRRFTAIDETFTEIKKELARR